MTLSQAESDREHDAMATVLIIGASRGIGLEAVKAALAAGHSVRALARSARRIRLDHPKLEKMAGDALGIATVKRALTGADVVIQSLGVAAGLEAILKPTRFFSKATRVLVTAMEEGSGSSDVLHALLEHRVTPFRLLVGHSKGALQINNAIQSLPVERTQGLRVVTLGCPIRENVAGVDYHQYLGLFDALGQLNAWGHWPDYWPPTWHSTNPVLPPAMAVGEMASESVRD